MLRYFVVFAAFISFTLLCPTQASPSEQPKSTVWYPEHPNLAQELTTIGELGCGGQEYAFPWLATTFADALPLADGGLLLAAYIENSDYRVDDTALIHFAADSTIAWYSVVNAGPQEDEARALLQREASSFLVVHQCSWWRDRADPIAGGN